MAAVLINDAEKKFIIDGVEVSVLHVTVVGKIIQKRASLNPTRPKIE
jgi:hypothetical protein